MGNHRSSSARVRAAAALTATALTGGGLVAGVAPAARAAGFDASAACPASAPSSAQVGALLKQLDERALTISARSGLHLSAQAEQQGPGSVIRTTFYDFVGQRASGKSRWSSGVRADYGDGLRVPALDVPSVEHAEDAKNRRNYRRIRESELTSPLDWAALAGLRTTDVWLRTTPGAKKTWPLNGYRPLLTTFAGRVRTDLPGATFSCTVDATLDPDRPTVDVVATSAGESRTLRIWLRASDGAPDRFRLTGGRDGDLESEGEWGVELVADAVDLPARSISPATYRTAATKALARELRDAYVLPEAGPAVAREHTLAKRVAALRSVSSRMNARFLRDLRDQGATSVTVTAKKIKNGKRYTVRYGDAAATITVTVKGARVSTATSVSASSSTAAPSSAVEAAGPATRATATGTTAFDPATLCPTEPTFSRLASVLNGLQRRMTEKSRTTGISTFITRSRWDSREHVTFQGDPVTGRAVALSSGAQVEDGNFPYLDQGTYVDLQARRSYELISDSDNGVDRLKSAALGRLKLYEAWERTGTTATRSWPFPGYLSLVRVYAYELLLGHRTATFRCSTSGSTLTVTATESGQDVQTLKLRVDADGAPVSYVLSAQDDSVWDSSGTVVYQRPRLWRPVLDYTPKQVRLAAVGGVATRLRSTIVSAARDKVARASTTAKRVAALRTVSARINGELVTYYNSRSSISFVSTAKKVTNGKKYTLRVGPDAVAYLTLTVKGKKIVTKTTVPKVS